MYGSRIEGVLPEKGPSSDDDDGGLVLGDLKFSWRLFGRSSTARIGRDFHFWTMTLEFFSFIYILLFFSFLQSQSARVSVTDVCFLLLLFCYCGGCCCGARNPFFFALLALDLRFSNLLNVVVISPFFFLFASPSPLCFSLTCEEFGRISTQWIPCNPSTMSDASDCYSPCG